MSNATLVHETANAPGTNVTFNLAGNVSGRRSFAMAFASGAPAYYVISDGVQSEWGLGTFTAGAPNQLSRTTVYRNSSNTTARLNFTGAVDVYNALPAEATETGTGWERLPNGLLIQRGSAVTGSGGNVTVTFPIAFTDPGSIILVLGTVATSGISHTFQSVATTGFFLQSWLAGSPAASAGCNYIAIGR